MGWLDGRIAGVEGRDGEALPEFDPSMTAIRPPYTALFNDYARRELRCESDLEYCILGGGVSPWDFGPGGNNRFVETADALRQAFAKNPYLRVYIGSGFYGLARISHRLSAATRDRAASTSLRLLTVLDRLFKYASAR
ncbi:MAG: hypothetical protein FJW31_22140 [Acidobacteria bacterium]|nr:hypothetical protein [Acidobacteriota bacterium]